MSQRIVWIGSVAIMVMLGVGGSIAAEPFQLQLRSIPAKGADAQRETHPATWDPTRTAVIVCDVWDLHHCRNAVRRLEEFLPRLDQLLVAARQRGATIIHAPSDCMPAYAEHPARLRAQKTPAAATRPQDIEHWCSRIPSEEQVVYPVDQSDGGEDDDPAEHAQWAAHLKALGRNPGTPWKAQSAAIGIDPERDFISDRGEEVWNILQDRGIQHVMLTGVHCNMCVLGRPFGLRQLARNGLDVVLVRDLTDSMYNPQRWPFVDHFTGHDLVVAHVERCVCPTITSDQILGGQPFRWRGDTRSQRDVASLPPATATAEDFARQWNLVAIPANADSPLAKFLNQNQSTPAWYRCAIRIAASAVPANGQLLLTVPGTPGKAQAWLNGHPLSGEQGKPEVTFVLRASDLIVDDANLLVVRVAPDGGLWGTAPEVRLSGHSLSLHGRWQFRSSTDESLSSIPLPARFGAPPDILFEATATER